MYNIFMDNTCAGVMKKDIMNIYEYYNKHFCGYIVRRSSFLRYLKTFDGYIIKMILTMKRGEWNGKDNKK